MWLLKRKYFQEAAKESKAALLSPEDQEDVESPLPSNIVQPVRRRGAISAEPINEEDAATYIKKVIYITFCSPFIFSTVTYIIRSENEILFGLISFWIFRLFPRITKLWHLCPRQLPRMSCSVILTRMKDRTSLMPCSRTLPSLEKLLLPKEMRETISTS